MLRVLGYGNWKELFEALKAEFGSGIEKEFDLGEVVQYYKNERSRRTGIN